MQKPESARRGLAGLTLLALGACGGVTQFTDTTAFNVSYEIPRPPEPVVEAPPPPPEKKLVEIVEDAIKINDRILFELDAAVIRSESHGLLDAIASVMQENPQIKKVDVVGHTDADGSEKYNQSLSERRAAAVQTYLVTKGVAALRLRSLGKGESEPLADNESSMGKQKNRRVEFLIIEQDEVKKTIEMTEEGPAQPAAEQPAAEQPAAEQPAAEQPAQQGAAG